MVTLGRDERLNVKQGGAGNECMQQELSVTVRDVMPNLHKQRLQFQGDFFFFLSAEKINEVFV